MTETNRRSRASIGFLLDSAGELCKLKSEVYIGPAGWSYPDWLGIVYPRTRRGDFDPLAYLASYFNLIEINSTFYRIPDRRMCETWVRRISHVPDFVFTVKLFSEFTHTKTPGAEHEIGTFHDAIEPIQRAGRLSAVLAQFPWSFRFSPETSRYLERLATLLAPYPTVVEVRHGSWAEPTALDFFRQRRITACGIDQPVIGDSITPEFQAPGAAGAYFRLHGRNRAQWFDRAAGRDARYNYLYSDAELGYWAERVRQVSSQVDRTHVVLNNHFQGQAVANALQLKAMLTGRRLPAPRGVLARFPALATALVADSEDEASPSAAPKPPSLFDEQNDGD
jgi:uncharacterized protein YecE (DUF72 family)